MVPFFERYQQVRFANLAGTGSIVHTVAAGYVERVLCFSFGVTTDATVATRLPHLSARDQDDRHIYRVAQLAGVTASSGHHFNFYPEATDVSNASVGFQRASIPDIWLPPGWDLIMQVLNGQAGDSVTTPTLYVERVQLGSRHGRVPRSRLDDPVNLGDLLALFGVEPGPPIAEG